MLPVARMMTSPDCRNANRSCCSDRANQAEIKYVRPGYIPLILIPNKTLSAIISRQLCMNAVQNVISPNSTVVQLKKMGGPTNLMMIVAGSCAHIDAIVKMKMATEKRFPVNCRSCGIDVTAAEEMIPLSSRFKLHRMPAMVHNRRSTFRRILPSRCSSWYSSSTRSSVLLAVATCLWPLIG